MRRALVLVLLLAAAAPAPAGAVSVKRGESMRARIFPSDAFTVRDKRQLTGRRIHLRVGRDYPVVDGRLRRRCGKRTYSVCDAFAQLNRLDGFDLQPRVTVPFTGGIDLASVTDETFFITGRGAARIGLRQLTFDPASNTLSGISADFLRENARYAVHLTRGVRDAHGKPVRACSKQCVVPFTTRTASGQLVRIRRALDRRPPSTLSFTQDGKPDVFAASSIAPSVAAPVNGIVRNDQVKADAGAADAFEQSAVPNLIPPLTAGFFAFGSFESPRYQFASPSAQQDKPGRGRTDGEIPPVPSRRTPKPLGTDRLSAIVVTPDPARYPPPWPAAVYGPGFTRSSYDIFVSADFNASRGILTVATDPSGHGFGPESTTTVTSSGVGTTFRHYGRGRDLDGDGEIGTGLNDGVGPTGHMRPGSDRPLPSRKPIDGVRSGLIQTAADNMTLARAIKAGLDIPGVGSDLVDGERISYYGISFGGIYGTMLLGADPLFERGFLNVPGGPIVDIARLSAFRSDLADQLERSRPNLLNGGPGLEGFTEDMPLRTEAPRVVEHVGAWALQELFAESNWFDRSGSPETFAPLLEPERVAFQTAFGDGTVPNFAAGTLYRAGDLFDRVTLYRNDKSPSFGSDPHGFLADPTLLGRSPGQQQLVEFLATGALINPDPGLFEVPIADPNELECLHYADPQSGQAQSRQPFPASGTCPPAATR